MQLDTQKHEVSQYLRSAHANRHAKARVSRCMNTRHAEGQLNMEVSSSMAIEHATGQVDAHVSPHMQDDTQAIGWLILIGRQLLYIPSYPGSFLLIQTHQRHTKTLLRERDRERERAKEVRCFRSIHIFRRPRNCREVPKDCPEEKEGSFRVMISLDQFIQDIEVGFWDLTSRYQDENLEGIKGVPDFGDGFRARIAGPPPASPIEDRGTAILIEDRDRAIPERLRLCGVIVKGLPVSLMCRKNDFVTSRKDHSARGTVGAGVDWTSFAKDSFSRYMNPPASPIEDRGTAILIEDRDRAIPERLRLCGVIVKGLPVSLMCRKNDFVTSRKNHSARGTVGAGVDWTSFTKDSFSRYMNPSAILRTEDKNSFHHLHNDQIFLTTYP
ncbi:hypothetical protein DY000_02046537 [Brassica cretica]|uniref:Uncharacterized protein n=1 Tax=Brassica cretica TaxID=69181 RepID=A0ABQ7EXW3_BRACR|nr:hypothetical protein DY000_02046537 [Brassica cretica]